MDLFPTAIVSWNEPTSYAYLRRKPFAVAHGLIFAAIMVVVGLRAQHTSWWGLAIFVIIGGGVTALPWAHHRWPKLFPLRGPLATLYNDRIARRNGKSQIFIALDNIASVAYWNQQDDEAEYWVLRFEAKKTGFGTSLNGILNETAIIDSQTFEQVVMALREQGIPVKQSAAEPPMR